MKDPISWDQSLVKKFSSSNHYKLLNQLRNEVIKYPLNNKKKLSTIQRIDTKKDNKINTPITHLQNKSISNNFNQISESNDIKSTVSFNNAKDFSIYSNNNITRQNDHNVQDQMRSNNDSTNTTFKDRLNKIDLK
tara:strand:+ start:134 stop:538 length:405 start_codon:yes stop_codon:yes gene_type:complete